LKWKSIVVREALTMEALSALEPRDAAAHFIARRVEGLTSSEEKLLEDWLARDQSHRHLLDSADRAWQSFDGAEDDEILTAMRERARAPQRAVVTRWPRVAAGAALLVAACAALVLLAPGLNPLAPAARVEYASARGEVREVQLADGSVMTLDADSVAIARFTGEGRAIDLEKGRAFFVVAHDESRPFVVTAAGTRVVALGTRFDVNLTADGKTVTLLEGRVMVGSATLAPGQQYVERQGRTVVRTIGAATENAIAWRTGLINFDDQPLSEAAAVMNRYSPEQIVISDPSIASLRVSGQFRARETSRFAEALAELHGLRSERQGSQIELTR
jgi:transmembrane sensor